MATQVREKLALRYQAEGQAAHDGAWERAPARIKVVGVGGGGCNCVRRMVNSTPVPGVRFAMVNTDIKALESVRSPECELIQIGPRMTRGWGAGGDPGVGEKAAEESAAEIRAALKDAGMGGGTGTGAAPYVAHLAKLIGTCLWSLAVSLATSSLPLLLD